MANLHNNLFELCSFDLSNRRYTNNYNLLGC